METGVIGQVAMGGVWTYAKDGDVAVDDGSVYGSAFVPTSGVNHWRCETVYEV